MEILKAELKDLEEILNLQKFAYQTEAKLLNNYDIQPLKQSLEELKEEFEKGVILKAAENGKIIGSIRGYTENNTLFIGKLIVHKDYRRKGIGKELLLAIESLYTDFRYELFTTSKSVNNLSLYSKLGYKQFKIKELPDNLMLIFLEKNQFYGKDNVKK